MFHDRTEAASQLIAALPQRIGPEWIVLGIPRGGVPIAAAVARHLGAPLDVVVVRKVGAPGNPEVALAAVTGPDPSQRVDNAALRRSLGLGGQQVEAIAREEVAEVARRSKTFADARPPLSLKGRHVLIVDDGAATGTTLAAAVRAVRDQGAIEIVAALPVALSHGLDPLRGLGIEVICPHPSEPLAAVGQAYTIFDQVPDATVTETLRGSLRP
nr:phosphoribosyltransferase family protein [Sagittula salina]